jgi:hypothetical protein
VHSALRQYGLDKRPAHGPPGNSLEKVYEVKNGVIS